MTDNPVSKIPQFGRRYEVAVLTGKGDDQTQLTVSSSDWEPEALRVTFEVEQVNFQAFWFAEVAIYNMNSPTEQNVLAEGMEVVVRAGYQAGPYGEIFRGKIFQALWERENVTDFKVTLRCVIGLEENTANWISMANSRNATQAQLIDQMAAAAHNPLSVQYLDRTALSKSKMPRGVVLFGTPGKYLDQVAAQHRMWWWLSDQGINLGPLERGDGVPDLVFGPGTGLIGTPQQTQDGVSFKVLLDPRLRVSMPPMQVKLDMQAVRQGPLNFGQYLGILDQDGLYFVARARFIGDTRGQSWYTEVTGYTSVYGTLALLGQAGNQDPRSPQ